MHDFESAGAFKGMWWLHTYYLYFPCVTVNRKKNKDEKKKKTVFPFSLSYLCDALLLLHAGSCGSAIVVVVGGVWFGSAGLLHDGFDCSHVGCSVSDSKTTNKKCGDSLNECF